jgi:hypothetical protein
VAWLEVRAYKGGQVEVLPWIENGYLQVAGPTSKAGTASVSIGGTQRFSQSLSLLNHQRAVLASGSTLTHWYGGTDPKITRGTGGLPDGDQAGAELPRHHGIEQPDLARLATATCRWGKQPRRRWACRVTTAPLACCLSGMCCI